MTSPVLDLTCGDQVRVRVYEHPRDGGETFVRFEGVATVRLSPMPYLKRLGPRWSLTLDCLPGPVAVAGTGTGCDGYAPGSTMIEFGERWVAYLLDRGDPERPYGADGPTLAEALEMSLDTFCVAEGLDGVTFS